MITPRAQAIMAELLQIVQAASHNDPLSQERAAKARRAPRFSVSMAAHFADMHPQTLRQYDRMGLVVPARTAGRGRRYSLRDIERLREIQQLSQEEGINLAGIARIIALENELEQLREAHDALLMQAIRADSNRVFAAGVDGEIMQMRRGQRARATADLVQVSDMSSALVVWEAR